MSGNKREKIFLRPLQEWPLFPVFWGVFVLGQYVVAVALTLGMKSVHYVFAIDNAETSGLVTTVARLFLYAYELLALWLVYRVRHNVEKPFYSKLAVGFIIAYVVYYICMVTYGFVIGVHGWEMYFCWQNQGCKTLSPF